MKGQFILSALDLLALNKREPTHRRNVDHQPRYEDGDLIRCADASKRVTGRYMGGLTQGCWYIVHGESRQGVQVANNNGQVRTYEVDRFDRVRKRGQQ